MKTATRILPFVLLLAACALPAAPVRAKTPDERWDNAFSLETLLQDGSNPGMGAGFTWFFKPWSGVTGELMRWQNDTRGTMAFSLHHAFSNHFFLMFVAGPSWGTFHEADSEQNPITATGLFLTLGPSAGYRFDTGLQLSLRAQFHLPLHARGDSDFPKTAFSAGIGLGFAFDGLSPDIRTPAPSARDDEGEIAQIGHVLTYIKKKEPRFSVLFSTGYDAWGGMAVGEFGWRFAQPLEASAALGKNGSGPMGSLNLRYLRFFLTPDNCFYVGNGFTWKHRHETEGNDIESLWAIDNLLLATMETGYLRHFDWGLAFRLAIGAGFWLNPSDPACVKNCENAQPKQKEFEKNFMHVSLAFGFVF